MSKSTRYPTCERCNRLLAGDDSFSAVAKEIVKHTPCGQPIQMTILPSRPDPSDNIVPRNQTVPGQLCGRCEKELTGHVPVLKTIAYVIGTIGVWVKGETPQPELRFKAEKKNDKAHKADKKKEEMEDWVIIN